MSSNLARLATGDVGTHLRGLAVPMAVGFVALNSFSVADTYFVSQLGTLPLAAMGFTFPVSFAMISVGLGLGIGVSSVVSRLLGSGDRDTVQRITTHALLLGVVLGVALTMLGLATIVPVFQGLGADERTLPLIREYMEIYFLCAVFAIVPMLGNFAIRATGDAMVPAIILSISAAINVILDPLLIFGLAGFPRLELRGAAIATVVANGITLLASTAILVYRERLIHVRHLRFEKLWDSWQRLLHIGLPAIATNLLTPITMGIITALVAGFGPFAVAGFGVASRVESFVLIVIFALSSSLGPFVGQNFGAGQISRVNQAVHLSNRFCVTYGLIAAVFLFVLAQPLSAFFIYYPMVIDVASAYFRVVSFTLGGFGVMMVALSSFNAFGRPMPAAVLSFAKMFLVYVPLAWLLSATLGLSGIFWANAISHLLLGVASFMWLRRELKLLPRRLPKISRGDATTETFVP
ncbi:MAG: MATE family efflux transporter [Pseudomonadota bacterium]|nr:MATE family efflux transporter [Pseudomonadota bacterium]